MKELVTSLHNHSIYSDGTCNHAEIAQAALAANLDVLILTDHNIYLKGLDGYHKNQQHQLLLLIGEEVHDRTRTPQKNHMLVIGTGQEMNQFADDPQNLIRQVKKAKGLCFLAHPYESGLEMIGEPDISWVNWDIADFTGIELWNGLSEFKTYVHNYLEALFYIFFPQFLAHGPRQEALEKWDELLNSGKKIVSVAGADAHAIRQNLGPIHKQIFPYEFHYRTINNHLFTPQGLSGDLYQDRQMVLEAFRMGHLFVGYDLPHSTKGFRFNAQGKDKTAIMGDEIALDDGVTLQIRLPHTAECRLIKDGKAIRIWEDKENCTYIADQPGVYRVECYISYLGKKRGWIFTNPIYIQG